MPNQGKISRLVSWKSHDEVRISRSLSRLMEIIIIEDGKAISREGFMLHANIGILSSLIELFEIESDSIKRNLIYKSVFHLRMLKRRNLGGLSNALNRETNKYLNRPTLKWRIVFPINIDPHCLERKRWFTSLGMRLHIQPWLRIQKELDVKTWKKHVEFHFPDDIQIFGHPFMPLQVEVEGRDYEEAFRKAEVSYELLRTIINWVSSAFSTQKQFGGRSRPFAKVPPPPIYGIFNLNGDFETIYYNDYPLERYDVHRLTEDQLTDVLRMLAYFNKSPKKPSTKNLILQALLVYGDSLNSTNWSSVFLRLWQALELITYRYGDVEGNIRMSQVRDRTLTLLSKKEFLLDLLWTIWIRRNRFVHSGRFSDDELEDVQSLKIIVENVILSLFSIEKYCPTWDSLVIYFNNSAANPKVIAERKRVLTAIQRRKSNL